MTTNESDVTVKLDDRVRLMSAVLSATRWPDLSQQRKPHGTHAHARATRKQIAALRTHEAVTGMQNLLDQGAPLEAMFTLALLMRWPELTVEKRPRWVPPNWDDKLRDFFARAELAAWWKEEDHAWQKCLADATKMFENVRLKPFFQPYIGEVTEKLLFIPNISYPTDQELGLRLGDTLVGIVPPRLAWGDSPPWPFDEDPAHVYRAAITQYGRMLMLTFLRAHGDKIAEAALNPLPVGDQFQVMYPTWEEQFASVFVAAAVAIYLEDHVSKAEANAYVLMERKMRGMTVLPGAVSVLRRYLTEYEAGRYKDFVEFLPVFPKQLRIAAKIVTM